MRQLFCYKMLQLLQITTILLQNAAVITKCNAYYKLRQYTAIICEFNMFLLENAL